jgi:hypothetical protein
MADVTISGLGDITPSTGLFLPASDASTTGKVTLSQVCGVMTSSQITTALGYTPFNSTNPGTGSINLPAGTTAQRPASPQNGMTRYNTSTQVIEIFYNNSWLNISPNAPRTPWSLNVAYVVNGAFVVPSGISLVRILCIGGGGGAKCDCGSSNSSAGGTGVTSQVTLPGGRNIIAYGGAGGNAGGGAGGASMTGQITQLQLSNGSGSNRSDLNAAASDNTSFAKNLVDYTAPFKGYAGTTSSSCKPANGFGAGLAWGIFSVTEGDSLTVTAGGGGGAYAYNCSSTAGGSGIVLIEY